MQETAQWSAGAIGAVLFVVALAMVRRRVARRAVIVVMALAGACMGGSISGVMNWVLDSAAGIAGPVTEIAFGVIVPMAIIIGVIVLLVIDFVKKKPKRWTPWAALLLVPAIGLFVPAAPSMVQGAVGTVANEAAGLWGQATGTEVTPSGAGSGGTSEGR